MRLFIFLFTYVLCLFNSAYGSRRDMHAKMFVKLDSNAGCFRRLNGTHQFGCSSSRSGNLGIIHIIKNRNDLDYFMDSHDDHYYVVALYMDMFISDVMKRLKTNDKVSGVVVIVQKPQIPSEYSPDDVCDNSLENCNSTNVWNPLGNKFLYYDWPFPIFVADDLLTITEITQCYHNFNTPFERSAFSRPLCSLQIKSHMSAAVDSPTCLRRISQAGVNIFKYCDPMGDQNIILPMDTWNENTSRDVVIVAARLDTASMFDGLAPGAMTSVTSFVTAITAAHIYSTIQSNVKDSSNKSVVFMLLNGEAQDHIGSSRIVYDIEKGLFPSMTSFKITLENIKYFFEISEIGDNPSVFMHPSVELYSDKIMEDFIIVGSKYSLEWNLSSREELPPSSFRVFKKAHNPLPGLIISNYDKEYTNKYYNGLLDTSESLGYKYANGSLTDQHILQKNIASIASTIASVLYSIISGSANSDNIPQEETALLVDELLHCYLENKACKLMKDIISNKEEPTAKKTPLPLYVGVQPSLNPITTQTGLLLAYLTSKPINVSKENCSAVSNNNQISYFWFNGDDKGLCINTTLKFTPAVSPAFLIPDYNWTSRLYSTWTESVWNDISIEMFLKPSRKQEIITLACGIGTSIMSVLVVYYLNKNNKFVNIFSRPTPTVC